MVKMLYFSYLVVVGIILAVISSVYPDTFNGYLRIFSIYGSVIAFLLAGVLLFKGSII
jgi:hypothetical protein